MNVKKLSKNRAHIPRGKKIIKIIQPQNAIKVMAKIGNSTCTFSVPVVGVQKTLRAVTASEAGINGSYAPVVVHVLPKAGMFEYLIKAYIGKRTTEIKTQVMTSYLKAEQIRNFFDRLFKLKSTYKVLVFICLCVI